MINKKFRMGMLSIVIQHTIITSITLTTGILLCNPAFANTTTQVTKSYQIKAGSLAQVINQFAEQSGILFNYDAKLVEGKHSQGLNGTYTLAQGFNTLLTPYNLQIQQMPNGYTLQKNPLTLIDTTNPIRQDQSNDHIVQLPVINIISEQQNNNSKNQSSSATGLNLSTRETPQSISIMTRELLDDTNAATIQEALKYTPGISSYTATNGIAYFYSRGYALEAQVNGLSFTRDRTSNMAIYDHVEVLRGPSGLLQGAGEPGGVINLVRKKPLKEFAVNGSASVGSYEQYRTDLDVNTPISKDGRLRGRAVISWEDNKYYYDTSSDKRKTLYGVLSYDLTPDTIISLSYNDQDTWGMPVVQGLPYYIGGGFYQGSSKFNPTPTWSYLKTPLTETMLEVTHHFNNGWKLESALMQRETALYANPISYTNVNRETNTVSATISRADSENTLINYTLKASGPFHAFGQEHDLVLGFNGEKKKTRSWGFKQITYSNVDFDSPALTQDMSPILNGGITDTLTEQSGIYGALKLNLNDQWKLILGSRLTQYDNKTRTFAPVKTSYVSNTKIDNKLTSYGGIIFDLNEFTTLYTSYSEIFSPQTQLDNSGKNIDPRVGWQAEMGIKNSFLNDKLNLSSAIYLLNDKNRAFSTDELGCANSGGICYSTAGKVQSYGLDTEISGRPLNGLNLIAGYTYNKNEYVEDSDSQNIGATFLTTAPKHLLKVWANYDFEEAGKFDFLHGFNIGLGVQAQSKTYLDTSSGWQAVQGGYAIYSAKIGYKFSPKTSLDFTVNNIFDKKYYSWLSSSKALYGDPANIMMTFRFGL